MKNKDTDEAKRTDDCLIPQGGAYSNRISYAAITSAILAGIGISPDIESEPKRILHEVYRELVNA